MEALYVRPIVGSWPPPPWGPEGDGVGFWHYVLTGRTPVALRSGAALDRAWEGRRQAKRAEATAASV